MKVLVGLMMAVLSSSVISAQESAPSFTAGVDVYSNYIWRGSKFGTGPAFQPTVKYVSGGLTVGVWGSFDASGYTEADPYISYSFPFGLSLGLTDYYYPSTYPATIPSTPNSFFSDSTQALEVNVGYTMGPLSLSGNYILNEAPVAASSGADMYFQAIYTFSSFNITAGAGNGWHTSDTEFNICHVGLGTSKTIKITDSFSIPVTGQLVVNPDKKNMFVVVGVSF